MDTSVGTAGGQASNAGHPDEGVIEHRARHIKKSIVVQGDNNPVTIGPTTVNMTSNGPVMVNPATKIPPPTRRPGPIDLRQAKYRLLDRSKERSSCKAEQPGMIELFGEYGIGKSSLLADLGYYLQERHPGRFADGFAYVAAQDVGFEDLLFQTWEIFWNIDMPWKAQPSSQTMRLQLRDIDALLLFDDPTLSETELRTLATALTNSTVVLTVDQSIIGSFANRVFVGDLDDVHLLRIIKEQCKILRVARSALTQELMAEILAESHGNPRRCIRVTSRALASKRDPQPEYTTAEREAVLEAVQTFDNPVPLDALARLTKLSTAGTIAEDLAIQAELDSHSPRYTHPWPKTLISADDDRARHFRLFKFLMSKDFGGRPDLRDLALEFFEWFETRTTGKIPRRVLAGLLPTAGRLATELATAGYVDRWSRLSDAVAGIGRSMHDAEIGAWADRNLGAIAVCRENWGSAREHLTAAISQYELAGNRLAVAECGEFLEIAIAAANWPDDGDGSASTGGEDPLLPTTGAAASDAGIDFGAEYEYEDDARELDRTEAERELVQT
ncbi:hypothetical protein ACQPYH_28160 [Kribbella sp. CA-245084]|uniref:hypothetical protein n=1 Tax=Kribbella sp. CA-245084 TaxID=3239940 RepID=UPI003D8F4E85